jgi:hypothetical protein
VAAVQLTTLPVEFGELRALRLCDLSYNRLSSLPRGCMSALVSLVSLNLLKNDLAELPPDVAALSALQEIGAATHKRAAAQYLVLAVAGWCSCFVCSCFLVSDVCSAPQTCRSTPCRG